MEKLTYSQAYDKIIQAYFRDEIKIFDNSFCFCGTLSPNDSWWILGRRIPVITENYPYNGEDYIKMEKALFSAFPKIKWEQSSDLGLHNMKSKQDLILSSNDFEDKLFAGMCAALDVLREIHKSRGEDVDGVPEFTKRKLEIISDK